MNLVLNLMIFALKMMIFALKYDDFAARMQADLLRRRAGQFYICIYTKILPLKMKILPLENEDSSLEK